ncbi:MAG: glucose-6-phosphate isomerase, partial [Mucinivorans sp.]
MKLNLEKSGVEISKDLQAEAIKCNAALHQATGLGSDFLGWVDLPSATTSDLLTDIEHTAQHLASNAEVVVVIGIGGSYLGAKSVLDALSNNFD